MPLSILVPLIVVGIAVVLFAVRSVNPNPDSSALDASIAQHEYLYSYPNDVVTRAHISQDGQTAWIELEAANVIGLVSKFGRGKIVRRVEPHHIKHLTRDGDYLSIKLNEFAMPPITLTTAVDELENRLAIKSAAQEKATAV